MALCRQKRTEAFVYQRFEDSFFTGEVLVKGGRGITHPFSQLAHGEGFKSFCQKHFARGIEDERPEFLPVPEATECGGANHAEQCIRF